MRYFDGLTSAYFKTAPDGRRLYFPWGFWGRGYVIEPDADYARVRRQVSYYQIGSLLAIGLLVGVFGPYSYSYIVGFALAAFLIVVYAILSRWLVAGRPVADVRMSLRDSMVAQATSWSAPLLWVFEIASLVFVAISLIMLIVDTNGRLMALLGVVFFGLVTASNTYMLVLRRQALMARS